MVVLNVKLNVYDSQLRDQSSSDATLLPRRKEDQEAFEDYIFGFLKAASLAMKSLFTLAAIAGALLPAAQACIGSPGGKCPIWPKEFSSPVSQKTIDMCGLLPATLPLFTPPE